MDRIEKVREVVDVILLKMSDDQFRRHAYVHLYGVSQACALLAMKRNENVELATIAGMLHDIHTYSTGDSTDHAHKGAVRARSILISLGLFDAEEIDRICGAIYNHSSKGEKNAPLDEILKDADVMHHAIYNPLWAVIEKEQERFDALKKELSIGM